MHTVRLVLRPRRRAPSSRRLPTIVVLVWGAAIRSAFDRTPSASLARESYDAVAQKGRGEKHDYRRGEGPGMSLEPAAHRLKLGCGPVARHHQRHESR